MIVTNHSRKYMQSGLYFSKKILHEILSYKYFGVIKLYYKFMCIYVLYMYYIIYVLHNILRNICITNLFIYIYI